MFCLLCSKVTKHLISLQNIRSSSCSQVIGRSSSTTSASWSPFESYNELKKGEVLFSSQIYLFNLSVDGQKYLVSGLNFSKSEDMKPSSSDHSYILLSLFQDLGQLSRDRKRAGPRARSGREKGGGQAEYRREGGAFKRALLPAPFPFSLPDPARRTL